MSDEVKSKVKKIVADHLGVDEEFKKVLLSKIPSGSLGSGEDVSNCVVFLASDMANYINGETIHVNGGMYMS